MKRDMELIRKILLDVEASECLLTGSRGVQITIDSIAQAVVDYHVRLLADGGYILGLSSGRQDVPLVQGLTWKGHDFVDAMRPKGVWERIRTVAEKLGALTLDTALELAKDLMKQEGRAILGF